MSNRMLSNTAYSTLATYIEYLFGLLASVLTARALLPSDMGIYSLLVWIVANAVVVANAGITLGAIKFIAELHGAGQDDLVAVLVRRLRRLQRNMLLVVSVAIALVFVLVRHRLAPGVDAWLLALLVASVALRAPYMFNIAVLKGNRDFRAIAWSRRSVRAQPRDGGAGLVALGDAAGIRGDLRGVGCRLPPRFALAGVPPDRCRGCRRGAACRTGSTGAPPSAHRRRHHRAGNDWQQRDRAAVAQPASRIPRMPACSRSPMRWPLASCCWSRACSARSCCR